MKPAIVLLLLVITLCSCLHQREPLLHEKGYVVEKQFAPKVDDVVTGVGITSNGTMSVSTHYLSEDEKYFVIFKCEHGVVFSVNKSGIYAKLEKGDSVVINYYEMVDPQDHVSDLYFVDANKIKPVIQ